MNVVMQDRLSGYSLFGKKCQTINEYSYCCFVANNKLQRNRSINYHCSQLPQIFQSQLS